jgi:hypothetical protein
MGSVEGGGAIAEDMKSRESFMAVVLEVDDPTFFKRADRKAQAPPRRQLGCTTEP